ncbi:hypothetical protein DM01DRAFT_1338413 [Hesseltinella vesiculosa]|uniref:CigA protein n=1 Tax=Hesseltinella vesiculosa TaxID=101127 RepID=A0A1X2G9W2_9FUNG|nr:hypothetical protein DM01DRAFT_1338413 [Hesseltinella vesiculosa]
MFSMLYIYTTFLSSFQQQQSHKPPSPWTPPAIPIQNNIAQPIIKPVNHNQQEKFLAYLPHSGLSNQRIELENALVMAAVLNRTLVLPPAFLGNVIGWSAHGRLTKVLTWLTTPKDFDHICPLTYDPNKLASFVKSSKCQAFHQIGTIPWTELHDLDSLKPLLRYHSVPTVGLDAIMQELQLTSQDQVYLHQDTVRYDWRLFEDPQVRNELVQQQTHFVKGPYGRREYYRVVDWSHWQERQEPLLYLGSVFGSSRLNLNDTQHIALQRQIKRALIYRLDTPLGKTVQSIVRDYFGGDYLGIHFRTADRIFGNVLANQIEASHTQVENALAAMPKVPSSSFCQLAPQDSYMDKGDDDDDDDDDDDEKKRRRRSIVQQQRRDSDDDDDDDDQRSNVNIYMATDYRHPRQPGGIFDSWLQRHPCTLTLEDIPSHYFDPLDKVYDMVHPSKPLKSFLMPLVDAMIAAQAKYVFLTPKSTFSKYIGELHEAWRHHPTS